MQGDAYKLPSEIRKLTLAASANFISSYHRIRSGENLLQRALRPSVPVLHLACALDFVAIAAFNLQPETSEWALIEPRDVALEVQRSELVKLAVQVSHSTKAIIGRDPRTKIVESDMVQVSWLN